MQYYRNLNYLLILFIIDLVNIILYYVDVVNGNRRIQDPVYDIGKCTAISNPGDVLAICRVNIRYVIKLCFAGSIRSYTASLNSKVYDVSGYRHKSFT